MTVTYRMVEVFVRKFVAARGYGPWYQRQAWLEVKNLPATSIWLLYKILDERWPSCA